MKALFVSLCMCVLTGCMIDDVENEQSVSQAASTSSHLVIGMDVDNGCNDLHIFSTRNNPQDGTIDYTFTDVTTTNNFLYTANVSSTNRLDNNHLFNILTPVVGRPHRFTLSAALMDSNGNVIGKDNYSARFLCAF